MHITDYPPELAQALDVLVQKIRQDERQVGVAFPYVTGPDGQWRTLLASHSAGYDGAAWSHGNWFCGFLVGLLAAAHVHSRDAELLRLAEERMVLVEQRQNDPNTHDIGFIFWSSACRLHWITGAERHAQSAKAAANRLRARLVPTPNGAYISAWGPLSDARGVASSAIDTMANIPLLYWAAAHTGDAGFSLAAEAHAQMSAKNFLRADDTLYHAVEYDPATGNRLRGYTFQGYADESSWSRGAGWAVYGLTASAAASGQSAYLDLAGRIAGKWLDQLGDRDCPPWDFDDPSPQPTLDSSAGAIMAAALLDLADLQGGDGARWRERAIGLLAGLIRSALAEDPAHRGLLRHGCYSKPHGEGTDSAVMFGDYFFVEALCRVVHPGSFVGRLTPLGAVVGGTGP